MRDPNVDAHPDRPADRLRGLVTWLLNRARVSGDRLVIAELGRPEARVDYGVLATLETFGPLSQAEIGRRLGIDRSDVVALLNRLADQDLVLREPDIRDRRRNTITLTENGSRRLSEMSVLVGRAQDELLVPLNQDERAVFAELLQRVVDHHQAR